MRWLAVLGLALAACEPRATIRSCGDDLTGAWATPSGRWMVLDHGQTLEAYALFDDSAPGGAPRLVSLTRDGARIEGWLERRYMVRADACLARAPLHVTACKGDAVQVVRGEVDAPLTFVPCTWPPQQPTHVETWRRDW